MLKFKADNAHGIKEVKLKLDDNIEEEMDKKALEQEKGEPTNASGASPSNIVLTWLPEFEIIAKTLGVRTLHNWPHKM